MTIENGLFLFFGTASVLCGLYLYLEATYFSNK